MQKIISLYQRNYDGDRLVRDEVVPGAEWVLNGEGVATRKYDGTCCMIKDGEIYGRHDAKHGKKPPEGFIPAQEPDPVTGHYPGWVKCTRDTPQWKWHFEAFDAMSDLPDGTYELCGPKVNGNPENITVHFLMPHAQASRYPNCPREFEALKAWLADKDIEGIVWHHPDGRMVKIKKKDFGLKRR